MCLCHTGSALCGSAHCSALLHLCSDWHAGTIISFLHTLHKYMLQIFGILHFVIWLIKQNACADVWQDSSRGRGYNIQAQQLPNVLQLPSCPVQVRYCKAVNKFYKHFISRFHEKIIHICISAPYMCITLLV